MVKDLRSYFINVEVHDPNADEKEVLHEYGYNLCGDISKDYDAIIIAVPHDQFRDFDDSYFASISKKHAMIADLKGTYRGLITSRLYWSF